MMGKSYVTYYYKTIENQIILYLVIMFSIKTQKQYLEL